MSHPEGQRLRHIVVPLDGSRLAEAALPPAFWLAATTQARLTLLHVLEPSPPRTVHGEPHLADQDSAVRYLTALIESQQSSEITVDGHVHLNPAHDVARGIAEHVDELAADAVVITTHGSGGLRGFLFGSIAQQVLNQTHVPVLITHPPEIPQRSFTCRNILVPLDGTADSERALPLASALANAAGANLRLLRVVPTRGTLHGERAVPATMLPSATSALLDMQATEAQSYLQVIMDRIATTSPPTSEVRRGDIVDEIERAVQEASIDLVVISTHGRRGLEGLVIGSVASQVTGRGPCPLLLIPLSPTGDT